ncbi:MAG: hypothetical protein E7001_03010 [Coriobacteriaceae bacterium]|nr:hypothetical protein [Coriobacteriaceae bacterium]
MATPAQTKATVKYIKDKTRTYVIRCHKVNDADIIGYLAEQPNVSGLIKSLIREKIGEENQNCQ